MNTEKWLKNNTHSLCGKTVAISGATGGLGQALCEYLARLGANLLLLDRNEEKSKALQERLNAKFENTQTARITLDLEDFSSVRSAAEKLKASPSDILILNAGAYSIPRKKCSTGYDNVFQINFVSPYFLARQLLPEIEKRGGKIVVVGSIAHNYSKADASDIDFSRRTAASKAYGNAKRFLMFSLSGVSPAVSVTHPGISFTGITAHYPKPIFAIIKHPMKIIFMKPKAACLSILAGIFTNCKENEWIGPRLFDIWGTPKKRRLCTCKPDEAEFIRHTADKIYSKL